MRKRLTALFLLAALLLGGCAAKEAAPAVTDPPATFAPTSAPSGPAARAVTERLGPYQGEMNRVSAQSGGMSAAFLIPFEILTQLGRDAEAIGAAETEGRWQFTVREAGSHTYEATAMDLYENDLSLLSATPAPEEEAPQDRQLMGDYDVVGGGEFVRVRSYDAAADLSRGQAEWTDTLNGETTGHEVFSFAVREGKMYFVDAAMDLTAGLDGLENTGWYLAAVGRIGENELDVTEYRVQGTDALPDPALLDYEAFLSTVTPLSRISDQNGRVSLSP